MKRKYFAHSVVGRPVDEWHLLHELLMDTANLARSFSNIFKAGKWDYLAGLWHVSNCQLIWYVGRYAY